MARRNDAPRDLLFGLLALQNGMVSRDQLVAAFGAWTGAPGRALADLLVESGALDAPGRDLLRALADRHLKAHGGDTERSLAAIDLNRSTRESLANASGPQVEATLAHVGTGPAGGDGDGGPDRTPTLSVGTATSDGQRFRVLRPHTRGGLGAVFVAMDGELHREVALKQILDRHADDPTSRQVLAEHLDQRGLLLAETGRRAGAEAELRHALRLADALAADFPGRAAFRDLASVVRRDLASLLREQGDASEAEAQYTRAIAEAKAFQRKDPEDLLTLRTLAVNHPNLGSLLHSQGRPAEAEREIATFLEMAERLHATAPDRLEYRAQRMIARSYLGFILRAIGRFEEADAMGDLAIADGEALCRDFPEVPEYRRQLANAYRNQGFVRLNQRRLEAARSSLERSVTLAEGLAGESSALPIDRVMAARSELWLIDAEGPGPATERQRDLLRRATRHLEAALAADPELTIAQGTLMGSYRTLGRIQAGDGDLAAAAGTARRIEDLPRSARDHFNAGSYFSDLREAAERSPAPAADRAALARSLFDRYVRELETAVRQGYRNANLLANHLAGMASKAERERREGPPGSAAELLETIVALAARVREMADAQLSERPGDPARRLAAAEAHLAVGVADGWQGREVDAARAFERARGLWDGVPSRDPGRLYGAACHHALLAVLAGRPGSGVPAADGPVERDLAMRRLRAAVDAGFRDVAILRVDHDLDPLRDRADFRLLMMDLAMPADPFVAAR